MMFCFISRILVQVGSCVNPFIYATTIPGFRKMVKNYFVRYGCHQEGEVPTSIYVKTTDDWNIKEKIEIKLALVKDGEETENE